jgi:hypothetical protein
MKEENSIWNGVSLEIKIACLITYASVFKDVISLAELKKKLKSYDEQLFERTLSKFKYEGKIKVKNGFVTIPELELKVDQKPQDFILTDQVINSKKRILKLIGALPFVKFVGISGSLAVGNPVFDKDKRLDLDVFIITKNSFLWIFSIAESIYRNTFRRFAKFPLCINFIFDESDLKIYNQNFYTAHEIYNLIPISGRKTYKQFLQMNLWVNQFFPGFIENEKNPVEPKHHELLNKIFYFFFTIIRCVKKLSLRPLKDLSFKVDPLNNLNYNRKSLFYGGYQGMVQRRFASIYKNTFPEHYDDNLFKRLFEDQLFLNYEAEKVYEKASVNVNYSKYE